MLQRVFEKTREMRVLLEATRFMLMQANFDPATLSHFSGVYTSFIERLNSGESHDEIIRSVMKMYPIDPKYTRVIEKILNLTGVYIEYDFLKERQNAFVSKFDNSIRNEWQLSAWIRFCTQITVFVLKEKLASQAPDLSIAQVDEFRRSMDKKMARMVNSFTSNSSLQFTDDIFTQQDVRCIKSHIDDFISCHKNYVGQSHEEYSFFVTLKRFLKFCQLPNNNSYRVNNAIPMHSRFSLVPLCAITVLTVMHLNRNVQRNTLNHHNNSKIYCCVFMLLIITVLCEFVFMAKSFMNYRHLSRKVFVLRAQLDEIFVEVMEAAEPMAQSIEENIPQCRICFRYQENLEFNGKQCKQCKQAICRYCGVKTPDCPYCRKKYD